MTMDFDLIAADGSPVSGDPIEWHAGVVSCEWSENTYPAQIADHTWNGWAVPRFTREVAEQVRLDVNADTEATGEGPYLVWTTDGLLVDMAEGDVDREEDVAPDSDGMYPIGAWAWTWMEDEA